MSVDSKFIVIGSTEVGKTSVIKRSGGLRFDPWSMPSIGAG
jgi:hypothetical protein